MLNIADLVVFLMRSYKTNKHPVPGVIHQHHDSVLVRCEMLLMPQLAVETAHDSENSIGSCLDLRLGVRC